MHICHRRGRRASRLGALCLAAAALWFSLPLAQATPVTADFLWLIDTSGSMYQSAKLPALQSRMNQFNDTMLANGIDAHYGLVVFRGTEALLQDVTDFNAFTAPNGAFASLTPLAGGGSHPERGSDAILIGLNEATFRPNSVINLVLFSDEDDQSTSAVFREADRLLSERGALFNAIADPLFKHTSTGVGNVLERYGELAEAHGGQLFDLNQFLNPATANDFFEDFTAVKVREVRTAVPDAGNTLLLSVLALPALFLIDRKRRLAAANIRQ